ncbi:hypothetical protein [Pseudomonas protegens]
MAVKIEVPRDFLNAIKLADLIIYSVKNTLKFGSGNQTESNSPADFSVGDSVPVRSNYPAKHLTWEARELYKTGAVIAPNVDKPANSRNIKRKAFLATLSQAGNCGEMANLAYVLCREYFGDDWTVIRASSIAVDHAFCLVYRNESEVIDIKSAGTKVRTLGVIVVDPWPTYTQALLWAQHFCYPKSPNLRWRTGAFKIFAEKKGLGRSAPSQTAIDKMAVLIAQLREGEKIESALEETDVLTSSRFFKYRLKKGERAKIRRRTMARIPREKQGDQYSIFYAAKTKRFSKFELLVEEVAVIEEERKTTATKRKDDAVQSDRVVRQRR